jgi:hypothetical protein
MILSRKVRNAKLFLTELLLASGILAVKEIVWRSGNNRTQPSDPAFLSPRISQQATDASR